MDEVIKKAGVLIEAIPYIHAFRKKVFVIKYGGSILSDTKIRRNVLQDVVFLSYVGIRTILVHGGGPAISSRLKELNIKSEWHEGMRVTDKQTLDVVSEELDKLNQLIVKEIRELKGDVTGLHGHENIIHVEKKIASKDLGFVGSVASVDKKTLDEHLHRGHITVVSPMGITVEKVPHNINADEVASAIANSMHAEKLVLLTNVQGVLRDPADPDSLYSSLTVTQVHELIKKNTIEGGMIPKVRSCIEALNSGVQKTHIVDARIQHALLLEFFTNKGIGTQIIPDKVDS